VLVAASATASHTDLDQALVDAMFLGFYFMLRGSEYLDTGAPDAKPLLLCQVQFQHADGPTITSWRHPLAEILACSYSSVTFATQKNGHKGAAIVHHTSGHNVACPVRALQRRVAYLRRHNAPLDTPITAIKVADKWVLPTSKQLTTMLQRAVSTLPTVSYSPKDVSPRSLRSGGAMALLLSGEDKLVIQLVGRWKSDALFTYLHSTALPLVRNHSSKMFKHGQFTVHKTSHSLEQAVEQAQSALDTDFVHDDNEPTGVED